MRPIFVLVLLALSSVAYASAPFCVVSAHGKQCNYYDAGACRAAARTLNGKCVTRTKKGSSTDAPFCVVSGSGQMCNYYDFNACQQAAETLNGTCEAR